MPGAAWLSERIAGFTSRRRLPAWRSDPFVPRAGSAGRDGGGEVVLFADNLQAAVAVLPLAANIFISRDRWRREPARSAAGVG